ncbi:MAG TPA: hypothetical protein VH479_11340, partial [Acidimicrobiales bacterium]
MSDGTRPAWAQRLTAERVARGWTQQQTVDALRMMSERMLPGSAHLLRMWKNWEHGKHRPRPEYLRLIATTRADSLVPAADTLELVERIRRSDLDRASLDTLTITVERLCGEYSSMPSADLRREGHAW